AVKSNDQVPGIPKYSIDGHLSALEREIEAKQCTLEALKDDGARLGKGSSSMEALLAPIEKLPNELITSIFRGTIQRPAVMGQDDRQTLNSIRRVCKRWDAVATSTPPLWRSLEIDMMEQRVMNNGFVPRLQTYFSRAGPGAPLRLSLGPTGSDSDDESNERLADFLTSGWNWHELHLRQQSTTLFRIVENIIAPDGKPWRSLKRLALDIFASHREEDIDLGERALPALQHLSLSFPYFEDLWDVVDPESMALARVMHATVPTLSLTSTAIINHSWPQKLFDPKNFPALRHLILDGVHFLGEAAETFPSLAPTILPVESLVVRGSGTLFFLDYLTLP
ncbi:hypothetical protein BKA70DRAFT_1285926, partial [Coprinopsis sp. MPI-PUGE-AT-0042]